MGIILNGFQIDPAIERLMLRPDWQCKRTSDEWLSRFAIHPENERGRLPFVEFCGPEWALRENAGVRDPDLAFINGNRCFDFPPGDFDPTAGYIIGFTDIADSAICVDLRPHKGARIIYDCLAPQLIYATAFNSISEFVQFYHEQHGD